MKTALQTLYQNLIEIPEIKNMPIDFIRKITNEFSLSYDEERTQIEASFIHGNRLEFYDDTEEYACKKYYNDTFSTTNKETLK